MSTLALVAVSARAMAEAAARDGLGAVAIDLFGDLDTRRASSAWLPAGPAGTLRIEAGTVLQALDRLARRGGVAGWVPGGGCEGQPELLQTGAALLPLIGCTPGSVQRVRDPQTFFSLLAALGMAHPEIHFSRPADPQGWLLKDAQGCGGWHIRAAASVPATEPLQPQHYFQRRAVGMPMSATFIANGRRACVLGCNALIVGPVGDRPLVYGGVVGPLALPETEIRQIARCVDGLCAALGLRGLGSLDFLRSEHGELQVLELNPRPPASLALYGRRVRGGTMAAHIAACQHGQLPELAKPDPAACPVQGEQIVFAPQVMEVDEAASALMPRWPDLHDLPPAGTRLAAGDPLCSVSAGGASAAEVRGRLARRAQALLQTLGAGPPPDRP